MTVTVKNLGPLEQATFEIGDMTIICGKNNTGKTYATHALFAFFDYLNSDVDFPIENRVIDQLFESGRVVVSLEPYVNGIQPVLSDIAKQFTKAIPQVFAGRQSLFSETVFEFTVNASKKITLPEIHAHVGSPERSVLHINSTKIYGEVEISLVVNKDSNDILPKHLVRRIISEVFASNILKSFVPRPFLASAERTGAVIFQRELDFTKNRIVELLSQKDCNKLHPVQLLGKFSGEYPIAVRKNVDFIRSLPDITNRESFLLKTHPEVLEVFKEIIGGEYHVSKDGMVSFVPSDKKRLKLSLVESSSAVRTMLDIGFYLRHIAQPGDMLMVDEPELNLHPENQQRIARLFARLVNLGIKVFITTHSDYIIKELNTLIMLSNNNNIIDTIRDEYCYSKDEILKANQLRVYIAQRDKIQKDGNTQRSQCQTLVAAEIDNVFGIEAQSFDDTIEKMNKIQELIFFAGDK